MLTYNFENYKKRIRKKLIKKHIWVLEEWVSYSIDKSKWFKVVRWKPINSIIWYFYN